MNNFAEFVKLFEGIVGDVALFIATTLEIMGIVVIIIGAVKAFVLYFKKINSKLKIDLGNALALGLEFKMGAEILKTVVVREYMELIILGAIILLRAILAFLIHWEIENEKKESGKD